MDEKNVHCQALRAILVDVLDTIVRFGRVNRASDAMSNDAFQHDMRSLIEFVREAETFSELGRLANYAHRSCLAREISCNEICLPHIKCLNAIVFLHDVDRLHEVSWRQVERRHHDERWFRDLTKVDDANW